MTLGRRWDRYWFTPEGPLNLGLCRVLFFALMCLLFMGTPFTSLSEVREGSPFWQPIWLIEVLQRLAGRLHVNVVAPTPAMAAIDIAWKVSLALACVGLFTQVSTFVVFVLGTYLIGLSNSFGKAESDIVPIVFVMAILALSRCGDAVSLDALWRSHRGQGPARPSGEYRWPVRAVWAMMAVTFFNAGLSKLRSNGIQWAIGDGFSLVLLRGFYGPNPPFVRWGLFVSNHAWLAKLLASGSLFIETFFPLALVNRQARKFFPAAAFLMQLGIALIMNIWFIHYLGAYLFWAPWGKIARQIAPRWTSRWEEPVAERVADVAGSPLA